MKRVAFVALALAQIGPAAAAGPGEPCGGFKVGLAGVTTTRPLPARATLTEADIGCAAAIGAALSANPLARGITVEVRLDDATRATEVGPSIAAAWVKALAAGGLPEARVSSVVPATRHGEEGTVVVVLTPPPGAGQVVAAIELMSGTVRAGPSLDQLAAVVPGASLPVGSVIETAGSSAAWVNLADGSRVRLGSGTRVDLTDVHLDPNLNRVVRLGLAQGEIEADVRAAGAGAVFEIAGPGARASVRGTHFRMSVSSERRTGLATLAGEVELAGKSRTVAVGAGQGAQIGADGEPSEPRPLLPAPQVVAPQEGALPADGHLQWSQVAGAAGYRVELARDAEFVLDIQEHGADAPKLAPGGELSAGKWFWRVAAVDSAELTGEPSKVYAFRR